MAEFVVEFGKDGGPVPSDGRLDAPAFHRNHAAIWSVLAPLLAERTGDVLEIGSGTGQHVTAFARQAPQITWWPSDVNAAHLASIAAWREHSGLANVRPPQRIDAAAANWPQEAQAAGMPASLLALICNNVVHIAPWAVAEGVMAGASELLAPDGRLFLYGPFMREGRHTAESNVAFDASLRARDPAWGVRDTAALAQAAAAVGLLHAGVVEMPANNLILMFERAPGT
jgi:SAM-dependent methyltransferase